jgi:multimeric flavodoxin WrbA
MAILVLWASPDRDGMTAQAKDSLVSGIRSAGKEAEEIHLNEKKILLCAACGHWGYGSCASRGVCALDDDFSEIYGALRRAEAVAFVTPVYWGDLSENFKALLDRLRRCEAEHNGFLRDKRYLAVACAGGYGMGATDCLVHLEKTLSHIGMKALDRIPVVRFSRSYMIPALRGAGAELAGHYSDFAFDGFSR